jgi:hypothetical protein
MEAKLYSGSLRPNSVHESSMSFFFDNVAPWAIVEFRKAGESRGMITSEHMKTSLLKLCVLIVFLTAGARSQAQKPSATPEETPQGLTEIESFQGEVNSGERLLKLDSTVGWEFNRHFGMFAGVPVYFSHLASTTTTTGTTTTTTPGASSSGIGNAYLGFALREPNPTLDYASALTLGAPTGDTKKGLSTGRATFDWDNRFEHGFNRFTPFFDGGLGNTVPDSKFLTRPFTSLGMVTHFEEGGGFELFPRVSLNGSAYEIVPFGTQKVFSKLVAKGQAAKGSGKNGRVFETAAETIGSGLTRENGFIASVAFEPARFWTVEAGYTRSVTFALDSFAFNVRMDVGKLLRQRKGL